ncbi:MAG: TlpA disulfide reductase family protein [Gudongella sp.]|nr:TlpA disulfide reductase family protein [Gudongella sp.]
MNKKNIIILVIAVVAVVGLSVFFFINMPGNSNVAEAPAAGESGETTEPAVNPNLPEGHPDVSAVIAGEAAPDFTLINMEGEEVSLSDYKGKLVYLNFWATWCGYCDQEMPDLQALNAENEDLVVLAVNVREDLDTVKTYIEAGGYDFPVILDIEGEVATRYLINGMPTTYFINSEGILLDRIPGMMEKEQMDEILWKMRDLEN